MLNAFDATTLGNFPAPLSSFVKCQRVSIRSSQCYHIGGEWILLFLLNFK